MNSVGSIVETIDEEIIDLAERYLGKFIAKTIEVEEAVVSQDLESMHRLAHSLKGTSGSYGFQGLYKIAVRLEACVSSSDWSEAQDIIADMKHYCLNVQIIPGKTD